MCLSLLFTAGNAEEVFWHIPSLSQLSYPCFPLTANSRQTEGVWRGVESDGFPTKADNASSATV
jgi:hypothetical protein